MFTILHVCFKMGFVTSLFNLNQIYQYLIVRRIVVILLKQLKTLNVEDEKVGAYSLLRTDHESSKQLCLCPVQPKE